MFILQILQISFGKNERSLAQGKAPDYRMNRGVRVLQQHVWEVLSCVIHYRFEGM